MAETIKRHGGGERPDLKRARKQYENTVGGSRALDVIDYAEWLESLLKCVHCDHLRHEHEDDDSPCFGGRTDDMKSGEGEYCMCPGFETVEGASNDGGSE